VHRSTGARRHTNAPRRAGRRTRKVLGTTIAVSTWLAVAAVAAGASPPARATATATHAGPCAPPQLRARLDTTPGFEAAASRELVSTVVLVNAGRGSCTLEGWPEMTLLAPSGAVRPAVQVDTVNGAFGAVQPTRVTLRPDGEAAFFVAVPPAGPCAGAFALRVGGALAGPATTVDVTAAGLHICTAGESIEVSAVHPPSVHLFQDYPGPAGALDPAALRRPAFPACRTQDLREVRSGVARRGSSGEEEVEVFFRNAASGCSVQSRWPVVSLSNGGSVLVPAIRDVALLPSDVVPLGGSPSPPRYVDLDRGAAALFDILVREPLPPASCRRTTAIEVRFGVAPGTTWSTTPAASYRTAVGVPSCAGEETLAASPSVSVTPITAVPDAAHPLTAPAPASSVATSTGDATGFGWGGDSSGGVCTGGTYPYGVEGLAKYGITGKCAGYFGQVGAAWSQWPGCPDSGWGWNPTDAAEAAANYPKYGVGNAFIYFTGGPGMKPPSVTTLASWADLQMANFAAQAAQSQYAKYVDEPVVILDVETGYGWDETVTDPLSGTVGCAFPIVTSTTYSAADNRVLLADMVSKASAVFPGYEVVVYTGGRYDWGPWFGSEAWKGGEYTFVNGIAGTPSASTGNVPAKYCRRATASPCAQFWGGQAPSSAGALIWQWSSPVSPSTATMDIDQIELSRFPVVP
jgi:hypothetical protein